MLSRRTLLTGALAGLCLARLGTGSARAADALRLGILPVMSARRILEVFNPLQSHLERAGHRPTRLLTSPNFATLLDQVRNQDFDLALLPPHMARLAQVDLGWQPLARCAPEHRSVILALEAGGPRRPEELRGGTLAVLDRGALVVLIALEALRQRGLQAGRDFALLETRNYESSRLAVEQRQAQALVSRSQGFFKDAQRDRLAVLLDAGPLPGYVFMAAARMPPQAAARLGDLLLTFFAGPEGAGVLGKLGYESLQPVDEGHMRMLDPYLDDTRASLQGAG